MVRVGIGANRSRATSNGSPHQTRDCSLRVSLCASLSAPGTWVAVCYRSRHLLASFHSPLMALIKPRPVPRSIDCRRFILTLLPMLTPDQSRSYFEYEPLSFSLQNRLVSWQCFDYGANIPFIALTRLIGY